MGTRSDRLLASHRPRVTGSPCSGRGEGVEQCLVGFAGGHGGVLQVLGELVDGGGAHLRVGDVIDARWPDSTAIHAVDWQT